MEDSRKPAKMPELLVFVSAAFLGLTLAEISRISYIGGRGLAALVSHLDPIIPLGIATVVFLVLAAYAIFRKATDGLMRLLRSKRADLLLIVVLGISANLLLSPITQTFHEIVGRANPFWTLLLAGFFLVMIVSSLIRALLVWRNGGSYQRYFLADIEVKDEGHDLLDHKEKARNFAETIRVSGSNTGLVYGVDAPWGTGKTSFINLVSNYLVKEASNEVIIFRFEPLRYASDQDLAERFIRDLSAEIQRQVYVPEFRSAATRYSRMLKGKVEFSFFGFKLALEPSAETLDELLEDIDDVLKILNRRLIVVIDDLDRLDANAVNNVLFTVQRTFKLTQAAYILCYDTENLIAGKEDAERARQFLEKFVNVKFSLFVDSSMLVQFLRKDWSEDEAKFPSISSSTMIKIKEILSEVANILEDIEISGKYIPLIGDMRKLKRFVNAILMMQFEKEKLASTDFHLRDLINLILLNLNFPGIFRCIYAEEGEGRSGIFSTKKKKSDLNSISQKYENVPDYVEFADKCPVPGRFLLDQLFGEKSLDSGSSESIPESVRTSRACFNNPENRNLESYLRLIVRFDVPEPQTTFKLYQNAVGKVVSGESVADVLTNTDFDLKNGEYAHSQFWRILVSQSDDFTQNSADDSIDALVMYLPKYSLVEFGDKGVIKKLRGYAIYDLIRILDRAGWGRRNGARRANIPEYIVEIAYRIYGEGAYNGRGLIDTLADDKRGVLGLYDLMLFRLQCCADRGGQNYNLQKGLIAHQNLAARLTGPVRSLAIEEMRGSSQRIFSLFKSRYIDTRRNYFDDISAVSDAAFLGEYAELHISEAEKNGVAERLRDLIEGTRSLTKTFIVYQLANRQDGRGAGVGCGYYDAVGTADNGGIGAAMSDYLINACFDLAIKTENAEHFVDFCLCNLKPNFGINNDEFGYYPTMEGFSDELNIDQLAQYWTKYGATIKAQGLTSSDKRVRTVNYLATYKEDLPRVFDVLDKIQAEHQMQNEQTR